MNTKDSMFILAIVGIVAIVGVIILVTGTRTVSVETSDSVGQAARATSPSLETGKIINAHSCNADSTCETNKINGQYGIFNMLRVGSYNLNEKPFLIADMNTFQMTVHGKTDFMSGVTFHGLNGQDIQFENLQGQGNAYACLDTYGVMYRSDTPCDDTAPPGTNNCYEVSASSLDWGIQGVYQNNDAYINQVYVNCNSPGDIVVSAGFACNPREWSQTQTVAASVSAPYSVGDLKGWEVTCVGGESQAIAVAQCCTP